MYRKISSLLAVVCLCWGALFFTGCDIPEGGFLEGYWKSTYGDGFEITGTTYTQYDGADRSVSFAGTIVNFPNLYRSSGSIIIRITDSGSWGKTKGYYYAIRWRSLSKRGVEQSCAANLSVSPEKNNGLPTYAQAATEYTEANGYFSYYGAYAKQ
jgi:hypothetical protein